jgi:periplasmic protein TonB
MAVASYQLKSDLARVCLPASGRTVPRRLAWANSISLLFLLVGILGSQSRLPALMAPPPLEQPVPVIVEPLPPVAPTTTESKETDQQNDDDKPQAPSIQQVTIETPAINFAVPTPGSLLVPMSVAPTPGEVSVKRVAPVKHEATQIKSSGKGGDQPDPDYPKMYQDMGITGTVVLSFTVNDAGKVDSIEIKKSCGSSILDQHTADYIKRRWMVPPVNGAHLFEVSIRYVLRSNGA